MTTTENNRADALTGLLPCPFCGGEANHIQGFEPLDNAHFIDCATCGVSSKVFDTKETAFAAWNLRAASPANQPAAAPVDGPKCTCGMTMGHTRTCAAFDESMMRADPLAPSPADERAAFEWPLLPLLPETVITTADGEAVFTAHQMQGYANAYGEMVRTRAASASATGAEGALIERLKLLLSGDAAFCRTIVARAAIEQAIAILSRSPAMAAEAEKPFGWAQPKGGNYFTRNESSAKRIGGLVPVYTAPQPAQADAPAETRLTDEQREAIQRAIDYADMSDRDSDAEALRALLTTPLPVPRAEVTDWQPIETVPKDGTEVVLLFADEVTLLGKTRPRVRAAAWLVDWTIPYLRDNPPTHWMPLPAAPFDAARAGEAS